MSLRDRLRDNVNAKAGPDLYERFGILANPFPASSQTQNNPHLRSASDDAVESRIVSFLRDERSQVVVIEGTQGVGKTNFLNFFEGEIRDALEDQQGFYVVRYLADPEATFEGTIRRLFQELGAAHLIKLAQHVAGNNQILDSVRSQDMRSALFSLSKQPDESRANLMMEWLLGFRLVKAHREALNVQFRLDTVESKTAALRDIVYASSDAKILKGIFLLLDELEKQDGVLGPTAVVRYLSALRAIIDSLPSHLFMMIAVTPDALRRYSVALPAFRSRLQNQVTLAPIASLDEALLLANFYIDQARADAHRHRSKSGGKQVLVSPDDVANVYGQYSKLAERRGDTGVRQREFLHALHLLAEAAIQSGA